MKQVVLNMSRCPIVDPICSKSLIPIGTVVPFHNILSVRFCYDLQKGFITTSTTFLLPKAVPDPMKVAEHSNPTDDVSFHLGCQECPGSANLYKGISPYIEIRMIILLLILLPIPIPTPYSYDQRRSVGAPSRQSLGQPSRRGAPPQGFLRLSLPASARSVFAGSAAELAAF